MQYKLDIECANQLLGMGISFFVVFEVLMPSIFAMEMILNVIYAILRIYVTVPHQNTN